MAFKEKISELTTSESIISSDCIFTGNLITKVSIKIDGTVEGSINEAKEVFIGKTAKINGDVSSERCIVYGSISGNVFSKDFVEVMSTGSIDGDITTEKIMVEEGACINGMVKVKNQK
jgi:cytoskeletal protein CcmA (bactofilin family)